MPTIARLMELADIFGCGVDALLIESNHRTTDQAECIAGLIKKLSEVDRELVAEVIEKLSNRVQKKAR
jgi:hypothetical protein